MELRIPFETLLKIALTLLLILGLIKLWPIIVMLIFAVLIAVLLDPIVSWFERHRARRGLAIGLIAVLTFGLLIAFLGYVLPSITKQLVDFGTEWPKIFHRLTMSFPAARGVIPQKPNPQQMQRMLGRGVSAGMYALEGLTALVFVLVVAMYLLVEGRRAYAWLVSFAPARNRKRPPNRSRRPRPPRPPACPRSAAPNRVAPSVRSNRSPPITRICRRSCCARFAQGSN